MVMVVDEEECSSKQRSVLFVRGSPEITTTTTTSLTAFLPPGSLRRLFEHALRPFVLEMMILLVAHS